MNPIATSLLVAAGLTFFGITMWGRARVLLSMRRENRFDHPLARAKALLLFGFGQKRMVDREEFLPGLMHVFVFGAFVVVALRTVMLFAMGFSARLLDLFTTPSDPF